MPASDYSSILEQLAFDQLQGPFQDKYSITWVPKNFYSFRMGPSAIRDRGPLLLVTGHHWKVLTEGITWVTQHNQIFNGAGPTRSDWQ